MSIKIIAEAGTNHNGCLDTAIKLVDAAYDARANYIKFQIINPGSLYVPYYWENLTKVENLVHKRREKETLSYNKWEDVSKYARDKGIEFSASVFDKEGVDFLARINTPFIKLASSDLNNTGLIEYISKTQIPLILSTGMASLQEIISSVEHYLKKGKIENLRLLHCVSVYPCSLEKSQLFKIDILKNNFSCQIGFSDHTLNSMAACSAVTKGITFIEKHFTLDKNMDGFDHKYASDPKELQEYIKSIRGVEASLTPNDESTGEEVTKKRARRGLYLKRLIKKGSIIEKSDIVALRPENMLSPSDICKLVGKTAKEDINEFHALKIDGEFVVMDRDFNWHEAADYWKNEMIEKKML